MTDYISNGTKPLVHKVIPIIDRLTERLEQARDDTTKHVAVRSAAARATSMMNKYYSATDESIVFRIAMSEFPFVQFPTTFH